MNYLDFDQDIPESTARAAHAGTSFVPEDRARQERATYSNTLIGDFRALAALATTPEKLAALAAEFERYRAGYRTRYLAHLGARARCMSSMITGPSNFPTRRNQKRNATADKRLTELLEFRERALAAIRKVLTPELAPIMTSDDDATIRLRGKIAKLDALQERMKASNAAIRKHAKAGQAAQIAALMAVGNSEAIARELLEPDFAGRIGFADYQLKNNGAEIRRLRGRLESVTAAKGAEVTEIEGTAARIEDNPGDNRVRIFFPGKPAPDVIARLKRCAFRWTPSLGCWQAYRNHRSLAEARAIAGGGV